MLTVGTEPLRPFMSRRYPQSVVRCARFHVGRIRPNRSLIEMDQYSNEASCP